MSQPIIKMAVFRNTEAFYQLSREERERILSSLQEGFERVGGKRVVFCDSSWSSEEWPFFVVEQFPTLEAVQEYSRCMQELGMPRYLVSRTILGTELQTE